MQIHKARHDIHAVSVQFARRATGPALLANRDPGGADATNRDDAVALDHDVHGALRRRPGTIDHGGPANDQPVERSLALTRSAVWRMLHAAALGLGRHRQERQDTQRQYSGVPKSRQTHVISSENDSYQRPRRRRRLTLL